MRKLFALILMGGGLGWGQSLSVSNLNLTAPIPPAVPSTSVSIIPPNSGNSTYYYYVVTNYPIGSVTSTTPGYITNVNNISASFTLSISWPIMPGATSYTLIRSHSASFFPGASCSLCQVATNLISTTYLDSTLDASLTSFSTTNAVSSLISLNLNNRDYSVPVLSFSGQILTPSIRFLDGSILTTASGGGNVTGTGLTSNQFICGNSGSAIQSCGFSLLPLTRLDPTGFTSGQVPSWNGSAFVPTTITGTGTVTGPVSSTNLFIPQWSGISGTVLSAGLPVSQTLLASSIVQSLSTGLISIALIPPSPTSGLGGVQAYTPVTNQFLTGVSNSGLFSSMQPTPGNLVGWPANAPGVLTNDGSGVLTWGAGGGSATPFSTTNVSSTVQTLNANCSTGSPCNFTISTTSWPVTQSSPLTLSGTGSGLAYIYEYLDGSIHADSTALTLTCGAGATCGSASNFPSNGAIPLYKFSATSGAWTPSATVDLRAAFYASNLTGTGGNVVTPSLGGYIFSLDPTVYGPLLDLSIDGVKWGGAAIPTPTPGCFSYSGTYTFFPCSATPAANTIVESQASGLIAAGWIPTLNQNTTGNAATSSLAIITVGNAATTGTTLNTLTAQTGAGTAVIATAGATNGLLGVTVGGAGISGSATIATFGIIACTFDGSTTQGDYVQLSPTINGNCHDSGSTAYPTSGGQVVGYSILTNSGAGTYGIFLYMGQFDNTNFAALNRANTFSGTASLDMHAATGSSIDPSGLVASAPTCAGCRYYATDTLQEVIGNGTIARTQFDVGSAQTALNKTLGSSAFPNGKIYHLQGASPVSISNVTLCGTTPSIDVNATDLSGTITAGTSTTSCTLTFTTTYTTNPHCNVTPHVSSAGFGYNHTATTLVVTATSLDGVVFDYNCSK